MAGAPDMFRSNLQSLVRCASAVTSDLLCCFMVTVRNNCPRNTVPGSTVKSFSIHASKVYLNQVFRLVFLTSCVEDMPHNVLKFSFITEIQFYYRDILQWCGNQAAWAGISNIEAILFEIIPKRNNICSNFKMKNTVTSGTSSDSQKHIRFQFQCIDPVRFGLKEIDRWKAKLVNEKISRSQSHVHLHSSMTYLASKSRQICL